MKDFTTLKPFCRLLSLLIIVVMLLFSIPAAGAKSGNDGTTFLSEYVQTLYDEESAIPVNQVKSVLQTSDGYMWFAGYQGLMRYDGIDTKIFTSDDGFPTYSVNVLYQDQNGDLWIGTNDAGLFLYKNRMFTAFGMEEGLPSSSVRDITESSSGDIIVSTTGGVAIVSPDLTLQVHPDLIDVFVTGIERIGESSFLCLTNDGKLIQFNTQQIEKTFDVEAFGDAVPLSLFVSEAGNIYIGTNADVLYIADSKLQSHRVVRLPELQTLNGFFEDGEGRVWVAADNGMGYLQGDTFHPVEGLLMNNSLECIYEDYEGSFWIASSRQGLLQLKHGSFTNISFAARLPDYTVNTTAVFGGNLYIGADEGLVVLQLPGLTPVRNELTDLLSDIRIRCILVDSADTMWICTYEKYGIVMVKQDGSMLIINSENGLAGDKVRCVIESSGGGVIAGTSGGLSVIRDGKVTKSYTRANGLVNDMILSLHEGQDGTIYAGSDGGGIYVINDAGVTNLSEKDGLGAGVILRMTEIGGGIFISTGNSICYMDGSGIRMIDKLMAHDDSVFDILRIGDEIWFLQSQGINICTLENLFSEDDLILMQMLRRDGLNAPITANSWNALSDEGTLYISTGKGVLTVDTKEKRQSAAAPLAAISEIWADENPLMIEDGMVISADIQRIELAISLLSFASEQGTISYMLEGFDTEYKTAKRSESSRISYTNLKGGDYIFRLYGTNASGVRSEEITLSIRKHYEAWEMPFVQAILAVLAISLIALAARIFIQHSTRVAERQKQGYRLMMEQIITMISQMADSKNVYTTGHSRRVAAYSVLVGKRIGLTEDQIDKLNYAALLHDIGNICIPDNILNKKAPLTNEEYEIIKSHASIGGELLSSITVIEDISLGARYHHERIDGTGYSEGLKGGEIPLPVKIISVCNALDSMMSDRPHKKALTVDQARGELILNAGTQFDEGITAVVISLIEEGEIPF